MNHTSKTRLALVALAVVGCSVFGGCRESYPHSLTIGTGDISRTHGEPAEGGYYTNWDPYAYEVQVEPVSETNPVMTQHVLIATVTDMEGKPLPNRRVEWILTGDSVGSIVEVDESGWRNSRGHKVTNNFAITHTNNGPHILSRGTDDPADDVSLTVGQTWCVISSPTEGVSHVIAYVPGIYDWDKHKVFLTKNWYDVTWNWPPVATNPVDTPHTFTTKVLRHTDGTPLKGYEVSYKITGGPPAVFEGSGTATTTVKTDVQGMATVTLKQVKPVEGANEIEIKIVKLPCNPCDVPALVATGYTKKTWIAPKIALNKSAPATALVGDSFTYDIDVSNPSGVPATDVVVSDVLPEGLAHVSSMPEPTVSGQSLSWSLGTMPGGGSKRICVTVKAARTGRFENFANVEAAMGLAARDGADTLITQPVLALSKEAPAEVLLCDPIPYTLTVRNTGDAPATNVRIQDNMPDGMTTLDGKNGAGYEIGTLNPGQSKQVQFNARVSRTGTYINTATVRCDRDTAEASVETIVLKPVLTITKKGPRSRYLGLPAVYEITVTNKGNTAARQTTVIDKLPAGATFIEASSGGLLVGNKVTWDLGTLEVGESRTVMVKLSADSAGVMVNTVTATGICVDAAAEFKTEIRGIPAILLECVDTADPILVGAHETYLIEVTNQGSAEDTNIVIECTLPPQQDYISSTGPTEATVKGRKITFAPLSSLGPKAKVTYKVVVKGNAAGDVRFSVKMTSDQTTSPVSETESTRIYE